MHDRSPAVARAARAADRAFPTVPTLPPDRACAAVALLTAPGEPTPDLRLLRETVAGLWRGPLDAAPDAATLTIVLFTGLVRVDGLRADAVLPLTVSREGGLVSFLTASDEPVSIAADARSAARGVRLWWAGRERRIALDALVAVPLSTLWDAPRLRVHRPTPRVLPPVSGGRGEGAQDGSDGGGLKIGHATLALGDKARDTIGDIDAGVRDLEERTKLSSILKQMFARRSGSADGQGSGPGGAGGGSGKSLGGSGDGRPREPGVMENLAGWVRWHTPLGNGLRRSLDDRMNLVERMLNSGQLDAALKMALSIGGGGGERKIYPSGLSGPRDSLSLTYHRGGGAAAIMDHYAYQSLQTRYTDLARRLMRDGDFRRAAYIYAQLLNNPRQAVLTLEEGELYDEGALMALESQMEPALTIRLLFKAGQLDAALLLARRTACFDQLAEASRADPRFHAYVIAAWTETLAATGQFQRALQVSDAAAALPAAPAELLEARAVWLDEALRTAARSGGYEPELAARGLLFGRWTASLAAHVETWPYGPATGQDGPLAGLLDDLASVLRGETGDAPQRLVALAGALPRLAAPEQVEQSVFWAGAARPFAETFVRAALEVASDRLGHTEIGALRALLEQADLAVMAADLGKLAKLHVKDAPPPDRWRVPAPNVVRPAVRRACVLGSGQLLIWREDDLLQLLDRNAAVVWRQAISDVVGIVPIGTSADAVIIQSGRDGARLTRFSSARRTFHPIGQVPLVTWHDVTSETQWLVQIAGEIGALDLVKLCAAEPEIEFLWSSALTERVVAVAFGHGAVAANWITRDVSPQREDVTEVWTLHPTGRQANALCRPAPLTPGQTASGDWAWTFDGWSSRIISADAAQTNMTLVPWSIEAERSAPKVAAARRASGAPTDSFQSCDFGRPFLYADAASPDGDGDGPRRLHIVEPGKKGDFVLEHDPATALVCLARGAALRTGPERPVLFGDQSGRLLILDLATRNVTTV